MSLTAALFAFTALSATSKIIEGIQVDKAAKKEAQDLEDQSIILAEEAQAEAIRVANARRKFRKKQKVAFLKNGVTLAGSPLLVLEETRRESQEEVDAIVRRGRAQVNLKFQQAAIQRSAGRAAFIGGILGFGTTIAGGVFTGSRLGLFNKPVVTTTT